MTAVADIFARAVVAHRAGRIDDAVTRYRRVLAAEPGHARARHLLGFALLQSRAPARAEATLRSTVRHSPLMVEAWTHLGMALLDLERAGEAAEAFRRALALNPGRPEAQDGLSRTPIAGAAPAASRLAHRQVVLAPRRAGGWHGLGLALARLAPDGPENPRAASHLKRAVALDPAVAPALIDLSSLLRSCRKTAAAHRMAAAALCLAPMSAAARVNLAAALFDLDIVEPAVTAARTAAAIAPHSAEAYGNLAQCDYRRARFHNALRNGQRARVLRPLDLRIEANLSTYHLALGDLALGWPLFRSRPARRAIGRRTNLPEREWTGEAGARLLVMAEQGLGDELLFASCWEDLAELTRRGTLSAVYVELDSRLRPLAARTFPELRWVDRDRRPVIPGGRRGTPDLEVSHWVAAGELPGLFRRDLADFPVRPRPLVPDPRRVAEFRCWLDAVAPGLRRVGLCWRSGLRTEDRLKHYPDLADCRPLFRVPGMRVVVLQYDDCITEIAQAVGSGDVPPLVHPDLDRRDDLDGVAALAIALDGVLSAETAVLALAGAVGAPSIGFDLGPNWVALGQPRNPWHPTVSRLHRRPDESWRDLMTRVAVAQAHLQATPSE